jgi:hypothetical protein
VKEKNLESHSTEALSQNPSVIIPFKRKEKSSNKDDVPLDLVDLLDAGVPLRIKCALLAKLHGFKGAMIFLVDDEGRRVNSASENIGFQEQLYALNVGIANIFRACDNSDYGDDAS